MKRVIKFIPQSTALLVVALAVFGGILGFAGINAFTQSTEATALTCQGTCVTLSSEGMRPNELAVKTGEIVQFNSADGQTHNLAVGSGTAVSGHEEHEKDSHGHNHEGSYTSGDFGADEAWRVQFKKAGTYQLHDHYNPELEIFIVVYDSVQESDLR